MVRASGARRHHRRVVPMAALAALVLLGTACGDDDDEGAGDASPTTEAGGSEATTTTDGGTEATGDPVTIVALVDDSGPSPVLMGDIVEATAQAINDDGGLNGHPIEIQLVDTAGDAAAAGAAVADIGDAVAVFVMTAAEATIADDLSALGVPIIGVGYQPGVWGGTVNAFDLSCESSPDFCANPNFLTVSTTFDAVIAMQVLGAQAAGATKVSAAACAEVEACAQAAPVFDAIAAEIGLEASPVVRINSTAADYASECIGFIQEGVDFIQIGAVESAGVRLIESCLDQGYEGLFGASAGSVTAGLLEAPGALAGGLGSFPWFVDDEPVVAYREAMEAAGVEESRYSSANATAVYSVMRLLQVAVTDHADPAAPLDGAAALAAMYQVQDEDLDGLIAPVSFSEDNLDRTRPCFWPYIKDEDGNLENPLGGLTFQCYPEE